MKTEIANRCRHHLYSYKCKFREKDLDIINKISLEYCEEYYEEYFELVSCEDIVSSAMTGLVESVKWDIPGWTFYELLDWNARQNIAEYLTSEGFDVVWQPHLKEHVNLIEEEFRNTYGHDASIFQTTSILNDQTVTHYSPRQIYRLKNIIEKNSIRKGIVPVMQEYIESLNPAEKFVIREKFENGSSFRQIAEKMLTIESVVSGFYNSGMEYLQDIVYCNLDMDLVIAEYIKKYLN